MENYNLKRKEYFERLSAHPEVTGYAIYDANADRELLNVLFNPETEEDIYHADNILNFWTDLVFVQNQILAGTIKPDYKNNSYIDACVALIAALRCENDKLLFERLCNEKDASVIAKLLYDYYKAYSADADLATEVICERSGHNPFDPNTANTDFFGQYYDAQELLKAVLEEYLRNVYDMSNPEREAFSMEIVSKFHALSEQDRALVGQAR